MVNLILYMVILGPFMVVVFQWRKRGEKEEEGRRRGELKGKRGEEKRREEKGEVKGKRLC